LTYVSTRDPSIRVVFGRREITKQINQGSARVALAFVAR
jgi:hypothetical protein